MIEHVQLRLNSLIMMWTRHTLKFSFVASFFMVTTLKRKFQFMMVSQLLVGVSSITTICFIHSQPTSTLQSSHVTLKLSVLHLSAYSVNSIWSRQGLSSIIWMDRKVEILLLWWWWAHSRFLMIFHSYLIYHRIKSWNFIDAWTLPNHSKSCLQSK